MGFLISVSGNPRLSQTVMVLWPTPVSLSNCPRVSLWQWWATKLKRVTRSAFPCIHKKPAVLLLCGKWVQPIPQNRKWGLWWKRHWQTLSCPNPCPTSLQGPAHMSPPLRGHLSPLPSTADLPRSTTLIMFLQGTHYLKCFFSFVVHLLPTSCRIIRIETLVFSPMIPEPRAMPCTYLKLTT